jgi:peroxiredoxin
VGRTWEIVEPGREPRTWRVAGTETVNSTTCVKLVGLQQSSDWDRPRADSTAWRRQDTVWMAPRSGYTCRVERVIERREPARRDPSQRSVLRYELESSLQYPGQLLEDRQREILLAHSVSESLAQLLPKAGSAGPRPFESILAKLNYHFERQPPTPYREALKRIQLRAEAGKRGEAPPSARPDDTGPVVPSITVGRPAPDFIVPDLTTRESTRLGRLLGRPIVMLFYSPTSAIAEDVLHFAQSLNDAYGPKITVLALAVSEDTPRILKQREELRLKFPVMCGTGLRLSYAVEGTPKWVLLDHKGVVRVNLDGWGLEMPQLIQDELKKWVDAAR